MLKKNSKMLTVPQLKVIMLYRHYNTAWYYYYLYYKPTRLRKCWIYSPAQNTWCCYQPASFNMVESVFFKALCRTELVPTSWCLKTFVDSQATLILILLCILQWSNVLLQCIFWEKNKQVKENKLSWIVHLNSALS